MDSTFLFTSPLKTFVAFVLGDPQLVHALRKPIRYRDQRGSICEGIPAQVLRLICSVWVRAHTAGVLGPSQTKIAEKAQLLLDALADVAIVSLIDEATGYQKRRAHNELQKFLPAMSPRSCFRGNAASRFPTTSRYIGSWDGPSTLLQRREAPT